jgi:Protein containing tetrapyrrole methyltransferase domain and MazG-like (predicted pyrophosphatase) domain
MPDMPKNPSVYVSESMPSLHRAYMVQEKAKRIGFDFESESGALDKVYEEISELKKELNNKTDKDKIIEEYGDIFIFHRKSRKAFRYTSVQRFK